MKPQKKGEKPASVQIQSVTIQQPQQNTVVDVNVVPVSIATSNHLSTAGFVFGIFGILAMVFTVMTDEFDLCLYIWILGVLAIAFGHTGARDGSRTGIGRNLGIAGYVLGYLNLLVHALAIVVILMLIQDLGN